MPLPEGIVAGLIVGGGVQQYAIVHANADRNNVALAEEWYQTSSMLGRFLRQPNRQAPASTVSGITRSTLLLHRLHIVAGWRHLPCRS